MSGYSFADRFGISVDDGLKFVNDFKKSLPTLFAWQTRLKNQAAKVGTVYTYFGRPRRIKHYMNSPDPKQRAFGYRTIGNSPIQGAGADILKIAIIQLWKQIFNNPQYMNDTRFLATIHDEIDSSVSKDRVEEIVTLKSSIMSMSIPGLVVPMAVGIDIGNNWGLTFPFNLIDGKLIPDTYDVEESEIEDVEDNTIEIIDSAEDKNEESFEFDIDF